MYVIRDDNSDQEIFGEPGNFYAGRQEGSSEPWWSTVNRAERYVGFFGAWWGWLRLRWFQARHKRSHWRLSVVDIGTA